MCEHILKKIKTQRPNTIQILWIVKNQEHRNIATLSLQLRSYNNNIFFWYTRHQYIYKFIVIENNIRCL